jgi:hypothetical protein
METTTSRELLDLTVERVRSLPVLLIVTFRPEFQALWTGQPQVTMLALNRLGRRDRTVLVEQIAGGKALPGEVILVATALRLLRGRRRFKRQFCNTYRYSERC